jgi:tetratricopeptide (TPR) repeat protein
MPPMPSAPAASVAPAARRGSSMLGRLARRLSGRPQAPDGPLEDDHDEAGGSSEAEDDDSDGYDDGDDDDDAELSGGGIYPIDMFGGGGAKGKEGEEEEEEALRCYERAAELKRGFVGAHFNRATLLASLGRSDEALVAYDTVLGLDPAYPHARSARGHVHLGSGELARAERDYRLAVELQPSSASELNNRCHVLHRLSRWSEAVAACRRAVGIDAGHSWAWYNLGKALEGGGGGGDDDDAALGEARASYERALSLQPQWLVMREALESARRKGGGGRDSSHGMDASSSAPALDHEERVATSLVSSVDPNQLTNLAGSYE